MAVVILSTGGTIASSEDAGGDASPELSSEDLVESVPGLEDVAEIRTHDFSNVPSPHFTVELMYELVDVVREYDAESGIEGVVVTQGTDILEETSYFVDLCYDGATTVVFTGAMRNPSLPSPDGPINLLNSVRTAVASTAAEFGTLVTFNDRIHEARSVTKMHSMNVDTFRTPEFGPLGIIDEDRVTWRRSPIDPDPTFEPDPDSLTNDVPAVTVTADMPISQIEGAADSEALCLAATGAGHVPETIIEPLRELKANGVPLVVTTRCPEGRLARHTYDFPGSERTLREDLGAHFSDRNLQKTRIKTIVSLAAGALERAFD